MKEILINRVFCGNYLDEKLGHEVINFMKSDDGDHCLYIVPRGYLPTNHEEIASVIFVSPYETDTVQVLAKATGLKQIALSQEKISSSSNVKNSVDIITAKECFNGHSLFDIFGGNENCSLISFIATEMRKPIEPIFISNKRPGKKNYVISKSVGNQSQRIFLSENSDDYNVINALIENESVWEPQDIFCPVKPDSLETFYENLNIKAEKPRIVYNQMLNSFFDKICNSSEEYDLLNPRVGDCFIVKGRGKSVFVGLRGTGDTIKADFIDSNESRFTLLFPNAFQNGNVKKDDSTVIADSPRIESKKTTCSVNTLRQLSIKELKTRFIEYLQSINTPPNTCRPWGSAAFKIWNARGPETFWNLIEIENDSRFEYETKNELIWNGIDNTAQYLSAVRSFRKFYKKFYNLCEKNSNSILIPDNDNSKREELKKYDRASLTTKFKKYLLSLNSYSQNSINVTASNALYLWRERGKEEFWDLICKDDFEFRKCSDAVFLEFFPKSDPRYNTYRSSLNTFRDFYLQYQ